MEYIKYTGKNGFQTYGFVKDNSHKLDQWRMRFGRFSSERTMRVYSYKMKRDIDVKAGEYIYIDYSEDYSRKFKVSKRNPLILVLLSKVKAWNKRRKSSQYKNRIEYYLNND